MDRPARIIHGLATHDVALPADATIAHRADALDVEFHGNKVCVPTIGEPAPGTKRTARSRIDLSTWLGAEPMINLGGGVSNVAATLAKLDPEAPVLVVNEGTVSPYLQEAADRIGLTAVSCSLYETPTNLIITGDNGHAGDRRIIREALQAITPNGWRVQLGRSLVQPVGALISASPKSPQVTEVLFDAAGDAPTFFNPTGSLPPSHTLKFSSRTRHVVCSFGEMQQQLRAADLAFRERTEDAPSAVAFAGDAMAKLHQAGVAGRDSMVVTRGRYGCVVADWRQSRIMAIELKPREQRAICASPAGAGDRFLGAYARYILWGQHLRHPVIDAARRAMVHVCDTMCIPRWTYEFTFTDLPFAPMEAGKAPVRRRRSSKSRTSKRRSMARKSAGQRVH